MARNLQAKLRLPSQDRLDRGSSVDDLPVIALFGPTSVGKTEFAIQFAQRLAATRGFDAIAVSADAMQVYKGLEVLTGVPSLAEQACLEHRLVSFVPVTERFSVGQYARLAHEQVDSIRKSGKVPIVVGGTGLYLRAALAELTFAPPVTNEIRAKWQDALMRLGSQALHHQLQAVKPEVAQHIEPNDSQRVVRALALHEQGYDQSKQPRDELWAQNTRHPTFLIGLTLERETLYQRIDQRVAEMVANRAREEVLLAHEAGASETAQKALGYRELLVNDIEAMQRLTRRFAKRQLTWMRKLPKTQNMHLVDVDLSLQTKAVDELLGLV